MNTFRELRLSLVLLSLVVVPVVLTLFLKEDFEARAPLSSEALGQLEMEFKNYGIEHFRKSKATLKNQVSRTLRNESDPSSQMAAMNIAVYFFPELLHHTHLEKQFAIEHFVPLQDKIEAQPGTLEAQKYFQALKTTVWNYENPMQTDHGLSESAEKMLDIYGAISWK
jgi:hypothetical protein